MKLLFLLLLTVVTATAQTLPTAEEVLAKAIARAKIEAKDNQEDKFGWSQTVIEEKLEKDGTVKESRQIEMEPFLIEGKRFLKVMRINGQTPQGDDLKKAQEREKKFRENLAKLKAKKNDKKDDDDDDVQLDEALIKRYQFTVIGKENVNGRAAYMLTFLPRRDMKLPEKKRIDKVLNRLQGKVWLDAEYYSIAQIDLTLSEPTTLMGGLGSVRNLEWKMDFLALEPGVFAPKTMDLKLDGRRLFSAMRVKQRVEFSNYRKLSELAELK